MGVDGVSVELGGKSEEVCLGLFRGQALELGLVQLHGPLLDRFSLFQQEFVLADVVALVQLGVVVSQLA